MKSNVTELVPSANAGRHMTSVPAPATGPAAIIAFPVRTKPAAAAPAPVAPEVRLARALKSLSVALAEQRVVLTAWRDALGDLKTTTAGLNDSLSRYRDNLQTLAKRRVNFCRLFWPSGQTPGLPAAVSFLFHTETEVSTKRTRQGGVTDASNDKIGRAAAFHRHRDTAACSILLWYETPCPFRFVQFSPA